MQCQYRKNRNGEWVVFGPASVVRPGETVTVTKKSGEVKRETIETISRSFDADGVACVYGTIAKAERRSGSGRCRECGGPIRDAAHHRAMGGLCGDCAFDEYDM